MSSAKADTKTDAVKDKKKSKGKTIQLKEAEHQSLLEKVKQADEYKDKYMRLYAEFENARKRMDRERIDFVKYANAELMEEFLKVVDDLERSIEAAKVKHQDYDAFLKGIEIVMKQLYALLDKNNVKAIDAVGKPFDPHCHEVLMQEESKDHEDGTVIEVYQKGFKLGDQILRTAKVKVVKN